MRMIRLPDVIARVGLGKTKIYALIKKQRFPAPVKEGTMSLWIEGEVEDYQRKLIAARPASQPTSASS